MTYFYYEKVQRGLWIWREAVEPFVVNELQTKFKNNWKNIVKGRISNIQLENEEFKWDEQALLKVMDKFYTEVFYGSLGFNQNQLVKKLLDDRNDAHHPAGYSFEKAQRALTNLGSFLRIKPIWNQQVEEIELLQRDILNQKFSDKATADELRNSNEDKNQNNKSVNMTPEISKKFEDHALTSNYKERQGAFLRELAKTLIKDKPGITEKKLPEDEEAWSFGIGRTGFALGWAFRRDDGYFMVELYMGGEKGKTAFDVLSKQKTEIEKQVGEALNWDRNEGKAASRVAKKYQFDIFDSVEKQKDVKEKSYKMMLNFIRVFKDSGVVKQLKL